MKKQKQSNKAVAYLRVSTDRQEMSIEDQEQKARIYCSLHDLELVAVLAESDVSGKTRLYDRPQGKKIKDFLSCGCSHVVSLKLDRLFRNAADALTVSEEWLQRGVRLHIVDMGGTAIDTGTPQGRMFFTMLAGFAEFERGMISERITSSLRHRKSNRIVYCKNTPYGLDAIDGKLVDNPVEAAVIEKMQKMRGEGKGYHSIANTLNSYSIKSKHGGEWHAFTVFKVLNKEAA